MLRKFALLLLTSSACAHAASAPGGAAIQGTKPACLLSAQTPTEELIREHGTLVDAYQLEGGVWLENAPVLVNEDFDFTLAMAMEGGIGAGLAAAKRKEHNAQKAEALAAVTATPALRERLEALRCCGVHVYFLLWGADSAVLRTITDVPTDAGASRVVESAARPLAGERGWAADGALANEVRQTLTSIGCSHGGAN